MHSQHQSFNFHHVASHASFLTPAVPTQLSFMPLLHGIRPSHAHASHHAAHHAAHLSSHLSSQHASQRSMASSRSASSSSLHSDIDMISHPLPHDMCAWTCDDVTRWLVTCHMHEHIDAFVEHTCDGKLLCVLDEHDLEHDMHITSRLRRKKIMLEIGVARAKYSVTSHGVTPADETSHTRTVTSSSPPTYRTIAAASAAATDALIAPSTRKQARVSIQLPTDTSSSHTPSTFPLLTRPRTSIMKRKRYVSHDDTHVATSTHIQHDMHGAYPIPAALPTWHQRTGVTTAPPNPPVLLVSGGETHMRITTLVQHA